jgi:hypothetical protein
MRFLRAIGKPAFVLTDDVVEALIRERVLAVAPKSDADRATVQSAFNIWSRAIGTQSDADQPHSRDELGKAHTRCRLNGIALRPEAAG